MVLQIKKMDIIFDEKAMNGEWCKLPYPNHPKGCPNYGKRNACPPFTKPFNEIIKEPFYLVIEKFDVIAHAKKMKERHPDWTERQCRNLLYWQKSVVSRLKKKAYSFAKSKGEDFIVLEIPEAHGVNLFITCKNIGIDLQIHPQDVIRKIMIIGKRK